MLNTLLVDILNAWLGYMMVRKYEIEERIYRGGASDPHVQMYRRGLLASPSQAAQAATLSFYPLGLKLRLLTVTEKIYRFIG